ncbi:MAG TPA: MFS transporter [Chloroflexota bacterium]|nr:MFS transporter [Chloroflexota bacterium]
MDGFGEPVSAAADGTQLAAGEWREGAPADRLTIRQQLTLSFLWLSLNFQSGAMLAVVIPAQVLLFTWAGEAGSARQAWLLGVMATVGAATATVIQPVVGAISDRTLGAAGRRRPYIAAGTVVLIAGLAVVAYTDQLVLFLLGFALVQIGTSVSTAAYEGLLPDRVPSDQRGAASGYMGLMSIVGTIASLAIATAVLGSVADTSASFPDIRHGVQIYYAFTAIIMLVGALVTIVGVREAPLTAAERPGRIDWKRLDQWIEPWRHANFRWLFFSRATVLLGLTLFMTFIEYYFARAAHVTHFIQTTAIVAILALFGAVFSALGLGIFSDRSRRVPIVFFATACMALASLAFVLSSDLTLLMPLGVLFGLGYGAYTSVDWALAVDVLPSQRDAGKDMGLWNSVSTLPTIIAPVAGSAVIGIAAHYGREDLGYRLVFALAVVCMVVGAVLVTYIQEAPADNAGRLHRDGKKRGPVPLLWRLAAGSGDGHARGFLLFWPVWEAITRRVWRLRPVPGIDQSLFSYRVRRYRGSPVLLPDGTEVRRGDPIVELHLDNRAVARVLEQDRWTILRVLRGELGVMAAWAAGPYWPAGAKALYGVTLLARGGAWLGFMRRDRPAGLHTVLDRFFMTGLMAVYSHRGLERLGEGRLYGSYPEEIWMSHTDLLRRYGRTPEAPE